MAIFVALAMVLRRKPDALTHVLATLRENPKYQGQDKLPVTVWMMAQVGVNVNEDHECGKFQCFL